MSKFKKVVAKIFHFELKIIVIHFCLYDINPKMHFEEHCLRESRFQSPFVQKVEKCAGKRWDWDFSKKVTTKIHYKIVNIYMNKNIWYILKSDKNFQKSFFPLKYCYFMTYRSYNQHFSLYFCSKTRFFIKKFWLSDFFFGILL